MPRPELQLPFRPWAAYEALDPDGARPAVAAPLIFFAAGALALGAVPTALVWMKEHPGDAGGFALQDAGFLFYFAASNFLYALAADVAFDPRAKLKRMRRLIVRTLWSSGIFAFLLAAASLAVVNAPVGGRRPLVATVAAVLWWLCMVEAVGLRGLYAKPYAVAFAVEVVARAASFVAAFFGTSYLMRDVAAFWRRAV